jgi:hypothetical protein
MGRAAGAVCALLVLLLFLGAGASRQILDASAQCAPPGVPTNPDQIPAEAQPPDADVVAAFRHAIRTERANRIEALALFEAGIVESGLRNLERGDQDSLGALQERVSIYGRDHALDPYASAVRFLRDAQRLRPWGSTPGLLAAAVQRPRSDRRGAYDAVEAQARPYLTAATLITAAALDPCGAASGGDLVGVDLGELPHLLVTGAQGAGHGIVLSAGQRADLLSGGFDPRFLRMLAWIGERHRVVVTALRRDHAPGTNHEAGRAVDIGMVDGYLCNPYGPADPCGRLLVALARLRGGPNELIGAFDPDGPGPAWACTGDPSCGGDHRNHVHAAYDSPSTTT